MRMIIAVLFIIAKMWEPKCFVNRKVGEHNVIYSYSRILINDRKERAIDIACDNMDDSQKYYAK